MPARTRTERNAHAMKMMEGAGYEASEKNADRLQDEKMIASGIHKHESKLHRGEPKTALARGGRARRSTRTKIHINIGNPSPAPITPSVPLPVRPPVAGPGPGLAGAPMPPRGLAPPMRRGGKVYRSYKDMDAGACSGDGRLEKTEIAARKRGGK